MKKQCSGNCCTAVHSDYNSCSGIVDCCVGLDNHVVDSYTGIYQTDDNYVGVAHDIIDLIVYDSLRKITADFLIDQLMVGNIVVENTP